MSDNDEYYDANDPELNEFIVEDDENISEVIVEPENSYFDKVLQLSSNLKPNESQPQKILKAHIAVLVSALGGIDHTSPISPPPYKLGHDALACLKDLKRWIKAIDEKQKNFDVALACAESGLVINDLLVILCQWEYQKLKKIPIKNSNISEKIMLSCLELLVLLTWPIDLNPTQNSEQQKLQYFMIKKIQLSYKKAILHYLNGLTLKAIIRLVLPTIEKDRLDRDPRDNSILKLVILFIRNIVAIEPANLSIPSKSSSKQIIQSDILPHDVTFDDISHTAVLAAFKKNKVLMLILTISGSIGQDFDKEFFAIPILEIIYLLIKGIKSHDILKYIQNQNFTTKNSHDTSISSPLIPPINSTVDLNLQDLLSQESKKKNLHKQNISTRHGRFGTLLSIRNNNTNYVVSGQNALQSTDSSLAKMDESKAWNDRSTFKYDSDEFTTPIIPIFISQKGMKILVEFIEAFLVGGCFNTLIENVSNIFSGASDLMNIDSYDKASYFYTISWFFNYKRQKIEMGEDLVVPNLEEQDPNNYGSVGSGLSEVNFILLISYFRNSYVHKQWSSLHVAMICFRELLQISHSIFTKAKPNSADILLESEEDELDRELAEGIIRKLFSFGDFITLIGNIPQTAAKHSPDYLKVCISVVHIILKSFESFANEDVKFYVQYKRKRNARQKKRVNDLDKDTEDSLRDVIDASDDEFADQRMREVTRERKLNFQASESKFFHTSIVTSYIEFLSRYRDLSNEEIKWCISYFHRLFVKRKDYTGLYRLDFMHTLQRMHNDLPRSSSIRKHVDEFIYYFMKKFKQAFERFPLPIEVLFPRFENQESKVYFATGDIYEKPQKNLLQPHLAKPYEFIREFSLDEKYKILVSALKDQDKIPLVEYIIEEWKRLLSEKILNPHILLSIRLVSNYHRLFINNSYLRLLLSIAGFDLPFSLDEPCELKPSTSQESLSESIEYAKKWLQQDVDFEDGQDALYFLRPREVDYDEAEYDEFDNDSIAFETVPNTDSTRDNFNELDMLDNLERQIDSSQSQLLGLEKGVARRKRRKHEQYKLNEVEKRKPKKSTTNRNRGPPKSFQVFTDDESGPEKSAAFVNDSDDDSDVEKMNSFFEREERLRRLLAESGGIINPVQLEEFKKVWTKLEQSNGSSTSKSVSAAMKTSSLFVDELDQEDINDTPNFEEAEISVSNIRQSASFEDLNSSTSTASNQFMSADEADEYSKELPIPKRKKTLILDDDED